MKIINVTEDSRNFFIETDRHTGLYQRKYPLTNSDAPMTHMEEILIAFCENFLSKK